ncbi:hypothetical protein FA13DRAFT_1809174 [Coprinellus micaceus]|uniref:Uncharacterized protein n=1 Tax=Coprinellus micaceus TaxID=71717 RepID=A0A4Y7TU90_COPMI|nr:hypothetical protein FA13DRAFT_1809174 [Coprinellus micaceus]
MSRPRISCQLVAEAKTGTIASLWALNDKITEETCSREVLDVVLMHIDPDLIAVLPANERPTTLHLNAARRGLAYTRAITTPARVCGKVIGLKSIFVTQVTTKLYEICIWSMYVLESFATLPGLVIHGMLELEHVYLWHADMLSEIIHLDDKILEGFVCERAFLKPLLDLWLGKPRQGQFAMRSTLEEVGHHALAEYIVAGGSEIQQQFLEAIVKRLRELPKPREGGCVVENILGLLGVAERIHSWNHTRQGLSLDWLSSKFPLYRSGVVEQFLEHIASLTRLLNESTLDVHVPRVYAEVLAVGVLPLMLELATFAPAGGQAPAFIAEICGNLGRYAYFPCVSKKQLTAIVYPNVVQDKVTKS